MNIRIFSGTLASIVNIAAFSAIASNCTPLDQQPQVQTSGLLPGYNPPAPEQGTSPTGPQTSSSSNANSTSTPASTLQCSEVWMQQYRNASNAAGSSGSRAATPELISHINAFRSLQCLCEGKPVGPAPALAWNEGLATAALENATSRASRASIKIDDASKAVTLSRALKAGYPTQSIMEYAAYGPATSASFFNALMQNPQICTKLMDPQLQDVGAAYAVGRSAPPNEQTLPETKHFYWDILLGEQISLSRPF